MRRLVLLCLFPCFLFSGGCGKPPSERGHKRILVLGDSLTAGDGVEMNQAYPAVLETLIREKGFPDVVVTGDGLSGSTTETGLGRLKTRLEGSGDVPADHYDILVLALGANDGLRRFPLDEVSGRLSEMVQYAQNKGLRVVLAGMRIPPHNGLDYMSAFEKMYAALEDRHKARRVPFLLKGVAARPNLNVDGIHPNVEGHKIVARNVLKTLEPLL